ncbi:hypothetical protein NC797_14320 [Aquibacillus sp. 3ASR75-11]|uniref:Uncharacterized protein n=1 Tax=Terrihalobacillus insolitus TaxID=2950438 RepID=A0A9X4ANC4_9BACI|nr:hypothetical protein [Terrihalobacillus insolitus]MDC3413267.1 hypothetical protein [Terrihalobacillus insolitus]MDC3425679.1 hypothetical protein [Terrihalobacillus insolitus]
MWDAIKKIISIASLIIFLFTLTSVHFSIVERENPVSDVISKSSDVFSEQVTDEPSSSKYPSALSLILPPILTLFFVGSILLWRRSLKDRLMQIFLLAVFYQSSYFSSSNGT